MLMRHAARPPVIRTYIDDVFSSYTRTGTGADATVTTNINMTQGYMVWSKGRSGATDHAIYDSARGVTKDLVTNSTAAETTQAQGLKSVSSTGHTWGTLAKVNTLSATYVDWVFRKASKFFDLATVTKSSGSDATISFPNLVTLGMVIVKRTDSTGSWYVWHRSLTAGKLLYLEQTAAEAILGHVTVSGTTVTLENGVIADGTYIVYAYAHDTSENSLIQCGSFTTDESGNATVELGWEPQYVLSKAINDTTSYDILDTTRGFSNNSSGYDAYLTANQAVAEVINSEYGNPTATGFTYKRTPSKTYIYLAIRRPNKPPTVGTEVYNVALGNDSVGYWNIGFPVDFVLTQNRIDSGTYVGCRTLVRLTGAASMPTYQTYAEVNNASYSKWFDSMTGVLPGFGITSAAMWSFRRAPGFFDIVCYTGTDTLQTLTHNLGVPAEFVICRDRTAPDAWYCYHFGIGNTKYIRLDSTNAESAAGLQWWNNTSPTGTVFTAGTAVSVFPDKYVAYLFASLPGISKIGSYTGNGTTQNIDCGFSAGARFVLIKATSTTGDWIVGDSTRGIVAGNDPYLLLNSTAAEVTNEDWLDPYAAGFTVNETTAHANVNGTTYIFLAIA